MRSFQKASQVEIQDSGHRVKVFENSKLTANMWEHMCADRLWYPATYEQRLTFSMIYVHNDKLHIFNCFNEHLMGLRQVLPGTGFWGSISSRVFSSDVKQLGEVCLSWTRSLELSIFNGKDTKRKWPQVQRSTGNRTSVLLNTNKT